MGLNGVHNPKKDIKEALSSVAIKLINSAINTENIPEKACAQRSVA